MMRDSLLSLLMGLAEKLLPMAGVKHLGDDDNIVRLAQEMWFKPVQGLYAFQINGLNSASPASLEAAIKTAFRSAGYFMEILPQPYAYSTTLVMGATITAMIKRTAWIMALVDSGRLATKEVVWLASCRPIQKAESDKAANLRQQKTHPSLVTEDLPQSQTESEAAQCLLAATWRFFKQNRINVSVDVTPDVDITKAAADPGNEKTRPANTEETLRHWQNASQSSGRFVLIGSHAPFGFRQLALGIQNLNAPVVDLTVCSGSPDDCNVSLLLAELAKTLYVLHPVKLAV